MFIGIRLCAGVHDGYGDMGPADSNGCIGFRRWFSCRYSDSPLRWLPQPNGTLEKIARSFGRSLGTAAAAAAVAAAIE